jgi:hypothetical protein
MSGIIDATLAVYTILSFLWEYKGIIIVIGCVLAICGVVLTCGFCCSLWKSGGEAKRMQAAIQADRQAQQAAAFQAAQAAMARPPRRTRANNHW